MLPVLVTAGVVIVSGAAVWLVHRLRRSFTVVDVDGSSMRPTYQTGDRVLVRRVPAAALRLGDVVVVERPERPDRWPEWSITRPPAARLWMIKRIAALPGDRVPPPVHARLGAMVEPTVPPGRLAVLGDNADASYDSRTCGYFPVERVLGVVVGRLGR